MILPESACEVAPLVLMDAVLGADLEQAWEVKGLVMQVQQVTMAQEMLLGCQGSGQSSSLPASNYALCAACIDTHPQVKNQDVDGWTR